VNVICRIGQVIGRNFVYLCQLLTVELYADLQSLFTHIFVLCALVFIASCATPIAPTGGPADREGPSIVETSPRSGTTNFTGNEIQITFSEFVNRGTLQRAISIEPDLGLQYEISWRRKTARIRFIRPLPENTTVILRIGTELTDTRNNKIEQPVEIALATGDEIDDGTVTATIRKASDGRGESGYKVFLYREPVDFTARANYIAETDTAGKVRLGFLSEGEYRAIWVDDRNRNRIWEPPRERAQPFHSQSFTLEKGGEVDLGTIFVTSLDTIPPVLEGVGMLTSNRFRLRFSEEIYWDDDAVITISDSAGTVQSEAYPLYIQQNDPKILFAQATEVLSPDNEYTLSLSGFSDLSGNPARVTAAPFPGSADADTVRSAIIGKNSEPGLFPDEPLIIGYSKFIDDAMITDSLKVVEGDALRENWPNVEVRRHRLYIYPNGNWLAGTRYSFLVWEPQAEQHRIINPTIWQRNQLGEIEITMTDTANTDVHVLSLYDNDGKVRIDTTFTGSISLDRLPPLRYNLLIFRDENGNGRWDPGRIDPFEAPEPYFIRRDLPVREGFTSEINVTFRNKPE